MGRNSPFSALHLANSYSFFKSQLKCHLAWEVFPDSPSLSQAPALQAPEDTGSPSGALIMCVPVCPIRL